MRRPEYAAKPSPDRRAARALLPLLLPLLLLLGACAPRLAPAGPGLAAAGFDAPSLTESAYITADGSALPLRHWQPPAETTPHAVLLALHGFNDYSQAFAESGPALAEAGLLVYAYDQRGFGEAPHSGLWAGAEVLTGDLATAAALLRERHPGLPLYLLGESMGGAVVLASLAGPAPPAVDGIVLAAPAVWARSTMPFYQRAALWLSVRLFPGARFSGRGLGIQASDNIEILRALSRDPLFIKETRVDAVYGLVNLMDAALQAAPEIETPTLLLYGEKDEVVPLEPTLEFWQGLPPEVAELHRFALYAEGWHMLLRDLQAQVVIEDVAAWTRDPAAPLPSRAEAYAAAALARAAAEAAGESLEDLEENGPKSEPGNEEETAAAPCAGQAC